MSFGQFILGILIAIIGFIFVWKSEWFFRNFGRMQFAEKWLGSSGGTRLMYKIIGALIIIVGLMHATNLTKIVFRSIIKTVFRIDIEE